MGAPHRTTLEHGQRRIAASYHTSSIITVATSAMSLILTKSDARCGAPLSLAVTGFKRVSSPTYVLEPPARGSLLGAHSVSFFEGANAVRIVRFIRVRMRCNVRAHRRASKPAGKRKTR